MNRPRTPRRDAEVPRPSIKSVAMRPETSPLTDQRRARAAAADRLPAPPDTPGAPAGPAGFAAATRQAVTADRRRRREAAVSRPPAPPPLLGEALRARGLFLLPDEDDDQAGEPGPGPA